MWDWGGGKIPKVFSFLETSIYYKVGRLGVVCFLTIKLFVFKIFLNLLLKFFKVMNRKSKNI